MSLRAKALRHGATEFGHSKKKGNRFYVVYNGKIINFGSSAGQTFYDHKDKKKKTAWIARHSKITNKLGQYVIGLKSSPSYWASKLLWCVCVRLPRLKKLFSPVRIATSIKTQLCASG